MSLLPSATMANKGTDYFGRRETDVRLEALITKLQAQIQVVESRVDLTDKTLSEAITAVKDTAEVALESAKKVDEELVRVRESAARVERDLAAVRNTAESALHMAKGNCDDKRRECSEYVRALRRRWTGISAR